MSADSMTMWGVTRLASAVAAGQVSCAEIAEEHLARIAELNDSLVAFSCVDTDAVRAQASELDAQAREGLIGPLHGVPIGIKDLIFTRGLRTSGGSRAYTRFVPEQDDVVVERLRRAGALIIGKTNTATFGFGPATVNALSGVTSHPRDRSLSPGGSSGGSAVAVLTGMSAGALGSDGGGSIRVPAALCGVLGMKPTFGLVPVFPSARDPRYPGLSGWESLEHIGPMARSTEDLAAILGAIAGLDTRDRHSVPSPVDDFRPRLEALKGRRVGVVTSLGRQLDLEPAILEGLETAARSLARAGADVEWLGWELPDIDDAFETIVALDADLDAIACLYEAHPRGLNDRIRATLARERTFAQASAAIRVRKELALATNQLFQHFDLIVTPTVPLLGVPMGADGEMEVPQPAAADPQYMSRFTMAFNLTGSPALSLPLLPTEGGGAASVQLVADRFDDVLVLSAAAAIEADTALLELLR